MIPVFADTSFYLALWNTKDAWHNQAVRWVDNNDRSYILTEFILVEVGNAVSTGPKRSFLAEFIQGVRIDPSVQLIPATSALFDRGMAIYARRIDKNWSLTDCISFAVMQEHGLTDALTADHHFEQAGFNILLK